MKFVALSGRVKRASINNYLIDWDAPCRGKSKWGKFQYDVKQFFRPYWENHVVCEELKCFGTASIDKKSLRIDLVNFTIGVAVEVNGVQHSEYNKFFHGDRHGYLNQIDRDGRKSEWCDMNDLKLIYIHPEDKLSVKDIQERHDIIL